MAIHGFITANEHLQPSTIDEHLEMNARTFDKTPRHVRGCDCPLHPNRLLRGAPTCVLIPELGREGLYPLYDCDCGWPYIYTQAEPELRNQPVALLSEPEAEAGGCQRAHSPPPLCDYVTFMPYNSRDASNAPEAIGDGWRNEYVEVFPPYQDNDSSTCSSLSSSSTSPCSSRRPSISGDTFDCDLEKGDLEPGKLQPVQKKRRNWGARYLCDLLTFQLLIVMILATIMYTLV